MTRMLSDTTCMFSAMACLHGITERERSIRKEASSNVWSSWHKFKIYI